MYDGQTDAYDNIDMVSSRLLKPSTHHDICECNAVVYDRLTDAYDNIDMVSS